MDQTIHGLLSGWANRLQIISNEAAELKAEIKEAMDNLVVKELPLNEGLKSETPDSIAEACKEMEMYSPEDGRTSSDSIDLEAQAMEDEGKK